MRNNLFLGVLSLVVIVIAWRSELVTSAIISNNNNGKLRNIKVEELNTSETWKLIENVMDDYVELSDAFHAPAASEAIREKRTIGVFRNIVNRTRSGIATVRSLFGGSSTGGSSSGGFRSFFTNLLNRVLLFLTTLWDRITGLFRGTGTGSSGGGLFSRLTAGITGLFSRFSGGGGGGGGLFGGLFGGQTTTTESSFFYPESDYVYTTASTTTTTTESYNNEVLDDKEKDNVNIGSSKIEDAVGKSDSDSDDKPYHAFHLGDDKSSTTEASKKTDVAGGYSDDFIPFPGDGENQPEFRSSRSMSPSLISSVFPLYSESKAFPHVVRSPGVLHLTDDRRYLVV